MPDLHKNILSSLIDASSLLVSSLDIKDILPKAMETIKNLMACEAASIMLLDEANKNLCFEVALGDRGEQVKKMCIPLGKGIAGKVALTGLPLIVNDAYRDSSFTIGFDAKSGFKTKSVLCVPLKIKDKVIGVAEAINPIEKEDFNDDDLYLLSLFANQVALVIQGSLLHNEILAKKQVESELEFARHVQESFLPSHFPQGDTFAFYGTSHPAREVGGDFFDIFALDDEKIGFTIGDVSGKGIASALFMAKVLGQLRFLAQKHKDSNNPSLVLDELNFSLWERRAQYMFVTMIYGIFSPSSRMAVISCAGHPYPFLYRAKNKIWDEAVLPNGLPVGIMPTVRYSSKNFTIASGDKLVFVTDGILEAGETDNESFINSILSKIQKAFAKGEDAGKAYIEELSRFITILRPIDDSTLLMLEGR